jgi:hypothetical protein
MFDRDRFDWEIACPVCGAKGTARASQEAFSEDGNVGFTVDFVSNSFRVDHQGTDATIVIVIVCEACDVVVGSFAN